MLKPIYILCYTQNFKFSEEQYKYVYRCMKIKIINVAIVAIVPTVKDSWWYLHSNIIWSHIMYTTYNFENNSLLHRRNKIFLNIKYLLTLSYDRHQHMIDNVKSIIGFLKFSSFLIE